ncbi:MAG: dephospho-CoA kinase [Capsulimonadaceae bacterium]|nr:dephospho-CoA kinase [Capsulimonadaceae bacterium]
MILGITGGIATGKSTIVRLLSGLDHRLDVHSISADAIARDLLDPGTPCSRAVIEHFGAEYALPEFSDAVNRAKLADRIFLDKDARIWLEGLLHPPIIEALNAEGEPFKGSPVSTEQGSALLLMEIPLLYESALESVVDRVLVTVCSSATQLSRIMERRPGLTAEEALRPVAAQLPQEEKARRANYVVDTDLSLDGLKAPLRTILDDLIRGRESSSGR